MKIPYHKNWPSIIALILTCTFFWACMYNQTPEHVNDAMSCRGSAINICGRHNMQSDCFKTAQRECMYWIGYRLKKGKLVKINNCEIGK